MVPQGPSEGVGRHAEIDKVIPVRDASRVVYRHNTTRVEIQDMTWSREGARLLRRVRALEWLIISQYLAIGLSDHSP